MIAVERLPSGYWKATISLPWPPGRDYVQSESSFHDEDEARDWAEMMIGYLTSSAGDSPSEMSEMREARAERDAFRRAAEEMAAGIESLLSSLPFSAPENVAFLATAKLTGPLAYYHALVKEGRP